MSQQIKGHWIGLVVTLIISAWFVGSGGITQVLSPSVPEPVSAAKQHQETRQCLRESELKDLLNSLAEARGRISYLEKKQTEGVPLFVGFNYEVQAKDIIKARHKGDKVELLFWFSDERGKAWDPNAQVRGIAKCWIKHNPLLAT